MIRLAVALVGLAIFGAIFVTIYYDPENRFYVENEPAFQVAPGEARQTTLQPTLAGTPIAIHLRVTGGAIDLYVMEKEWSDSLARGGTLDLGQPFSFDAGQSRLGLEGVADFAIVSDGVTDLLLVFDNSDNHYLNDTAPSTDGPTGGAVSIEMTVRYLGEEKRSLTLGYLAAIPSVLLVLVTLGRKAWRWRRGRRAP